MCLVMSQKCLKKLLVVVRILRFFTIMNSLNRNVFLVIVTDIRSIQVFLIPWYTHTVLKKSPVCQKKVPTFENS